jgi:hypothetical protein
MPTGYTAAIKDGISFGWDFPVGFKKPTPDVRVCQDATRDSITTEILPPKTDRYRPRAGKR